VRRGSSRIGLLETMKEALADTPDVRLIRLNEGFRSGAMSTEVVVALIGVSNAVVVGLVAGILKILEKSKDQKTVIKVESKKDKSIHFEIPGKPTDDDVRRVLEVARAVDECIIVIEETEE